MEGIEIKNIMVREAKDHDSEMLLQLWKKLSCDHLTKDPYWNKDITFCGTKDMYKNALSNNNCKIYVCEVDNKIVGYIEIWIKEKNQDFYIDKYAYILHTYVEKDYRKFDIINELFIAAENYAKENNVKYLQADVYEHNKKVANALNYYGLKNYRSRLVKYLG